ncbi:MAG: hypothetical protein QOE45_3499, partial [Frankiaceae bacterium]|nr:hypothetical protein [Frankiaceae bacterium]
YPVTVRALWHEGHYRRNLCDADDRALNPMVDYLAERDPEPYASPFVFRG